MDLCWYMVKMTFKLSFRMGKKEDLSGYDECGWCLTLQQVRSVFPTGIYWDDITNISRVYCTDKNPKKVNYPVS